MKKILSDHWKIWKNTFNSWSASDPFIQSASLAYFALFSIPGLVIIVLWVSGMFVEDRLIWEQINEEVAAVAGDDSVDNIRTIVADAGVNDSSSAFFKVVGIIAMVYGATTLFFQLQKVLNNLWKVRAVPKSNLRKFLLDRVSSLGLILVIAFLLLVSLVASALVSATGNWITGQLGQEMYLAIEGVNFLLSVGVATLLFAMMYKILPDVDIEWKSVFIGALVTALLFALGEKLMSLYFSLADPTSGFGAAGTVVLLLLWVNYSCLIFFLGAQFTKEYALYHGHRIKPSSHAEWEDATG